ncbi:hypothetical protein [Flavobacterium sp. HNIBRBA15423]|uniref:hypothetical protein n=1 Tax=Flavobacterium sp. HNIBRBA15423 TaxID=3458683 RepID=UPI004043E244
MGTIKRSYLYVTLMIIMIIVAIIYRYYNIKNDRVIFDLYFNNKSFKESKFNSYYLFGIKSNHSYKNFDISKLELENKNLTIISRNDTPFYHNYIISNDFNKILKNSDSLFYYEYQSLSKTIDYELFSKLYGDDVSSLNTYFNLISNSFNKTKKFYYINEIIDNNEFKIDFIKKMEIKKIISNNKNKDKLYVWFVNYGLYEFNLLIKNDLIVDINDKFVFFIGLEVN